MWSILSAALGALFKTAFDALNQLLARKNDEQTHERAATAEAADETQHIIAEVADARSKIPDFPDDPDALARELRRRKS